jgi:NAD(P)-dependent dehydrogenase (short-subunit alcohol dehydrogenase family)
VKLGGTVAVVAVPEGAALARRLVAEGATVVITGAAAEEAGRMLHELGDGPGRVAYFSGDADSDAFVEFVAEQFKSAEQFTTGDRS